MFTPEQLEALKAPLDSSHVKQRSQAGRQLSYVEGWHAIAEANRIFGFDAWTRETVECRCVTEKPRTFGKPPYGKEGWGVSYVARVRVMVGPIIREGVGAGHGIDADLGQAHESAIKEAETDAMKRALMTFGNPFGLALYDKEQREVTNGGGTAMRRGDAAGAATTAHTPPPAKLTAEEWANRAIAELNATADPDRWLDENGKALEALEKRDPRLYENVQGAFEAAKKAQKQLNSMAAA